MYTLILRTHHFARIRPSNNLHGWFCNCAIAPASLIRDRSFVADEISQFGCSSKDSCNFSILRLCVTVIRLVVTNENPEQWWWIIEILAGEALSEDTYDGYCTLFGPIQSAGSVSASPHTYFKPRSFPSHFLAPWAHVVTTSRIRPRYLDIWNYIKETIIITHLIKSNCLSIRERV